MRLWLVVLLAACETADPAKSPPVPIKPTAAQCDRLLGHLIDLEFARGGIDVAAQKQAVIDAKRNDFNKTCMEKTPVVRVECALAARDLDGVAKCDAAP